MNRILTRLLLWLAAMILVPLATIFIPRTIDVYRWVGIGGWVGIGAALVIAITPLTLRRIARDFIDRDDTRGAVISFVVFAILVAMVFFNGMTASTFLG